MRTFIFFIPILLSTINAFELFGKQNLVLLPSVAFRDHSKAHSTNWISTSQGWYYQEDPMKATLMVLALEKGIGKKFDFNRIQLFTADGLENKNVCIDTFNQTFCTSTDEQGQLKLTFQITQNDIDRLIQSNTNVSNIFYRMSVSKTKIQITGETYLCDDHGITFISDIDDTIKITGVTSSTETVINTFSEQYKSVSGMPAIYQYWQRKYNATFAYLTASPDQLYPFLRAFFDRENFPIGSFHMRHFTWLDKNFISFFISNSYIQSKTETIDTFISNTLNRTFILMGDIFQKDPEIYSTIYMKYPNRIGKLFIRKYKDDAIGQQRLEELFVNIPREKWATFETGSDLPKDIFIA